MQPSPLRFVRRLLPLLASVACVALIAGCGGSSDEAVASNAQTQPSAPASSGEADDDHDDGDDEHDSDHDDDEHDDDDHDSDHDDGEHDDHDDHDDEGASGGLDAHVHGAAELLVASSGSDVVVELISPAENIFGFEYEPSTDEDIALVEERTAVLTTPAMLVFNDQAGCTIAGDVESEYLVEGSHAEVTATWLFTCADPGELRELDVSTLFAEFPGIEDLDAQIATDAGQSAAELSASSTTLQLG